MKRIKRIKNLNEIIFVWYIFSFLAFLLISKFLGVLCYRILYISNVLILFVLSLIKNKKIIIKKDIMLLLVIVGAGIVDFCFRRNSYTIGVYINFIQECYLTCYFFNRTSNTKSIIKYLALGAKCTVILYLFDPFFGYFFSYNYMGYGYNTMMLSLFSIYINYLIKKDITDLVYLIIGTIGIIIYGNRACLLAIAFIIVLTLKPLIKGVKKSIKRAKKNKYGVAKKTVKIIILFFISFIINYLLIMKMPNMLKTGNIIVTQNVVENQNIIATQNVVENQNIIATQNTVKGEDDKKDFSFKSYALLKYKEVFDGSYGGIFSGRLALYEEAIKVIKNTYSTDISKALFGNGTRYFSSLNEKGTYPHSIIFDLLIDYGIIGTILFISLFMYCLIRWIKNSKKEKYLFGVYLITLSFPRLLLGGCIEKTVYVLIFILFVTAKYPLRRNRKCNKKYFLRGKINEDCDDRT